MKAIAAETLAWLCSELAPGGHVTRLRRLRGGVSCSVHGVHLVTAQGQSLRVVVRRYGQDWARDTGVCGREYRLLGVLSKAGLPVPEPLLLDEPNATLVMTRLPGQGTLRPANLESYLDQLADALARLHQLDTSDLRFLPPQRKRDVRALSHGPRTEHPLTRQVWRKVEAMWPSIPEGKSLVHGDFWPGNTVWYRTKLSGVVDWEMAALGDPMRDVATCRCDLANLFDLATADRFAALYERAAGAPLRDLAFWDLFVSTGALRYIEYWSRGYRDLGRLDLTADEANRRVSIFAEAALADAQG